MSNVGKMYMSEQQVLVPGPAGKLQLKFNSGSNSTLLLMCHPHPQYDGTMDNKVVTTVVTAAHKLGMQTARFNFRGVGLSEGSYGEIAGEVEDARAILEYLQQNLSFNRLIIAGFSFGSYVAAALASECDADCIVCIAPPTERMPFSELGALPQNRLLLQGMSDEVIDPNHAIEWGRSRGLDSYLLEDVSHFFHGRLVYLRNLLQCYWRTVFADLS